jgi:hypothetical protein
MYKKEEQDISKCLAEPVLNVGEKSRTKLCRSSRGHLPLHLMQLGPERATKQALLFLFNVLGLLSILEGFLEA